MSCSFLPLPKKYKYSVTPNRFHAFYSLFYNGFMPINPPPLLSISLHSKTCTHSKYANKQDINSQPGLEPLESRGHQAESGAKRAEWRGHRIMQIILEFQAYFSTLIFIFSLLKYVHQIQKRNEI